MFVFLLNKPKSREISLEKKALSWYNRAMKKYFLAFGFLAVYFSLGWAAGEEAENWKPKIEENTLSAVDCRKNENFWINVPFYKEGSGTLQGRCLAQDSCKGLELEYKIFVNAKDTEGKMLTAEYNAKDIKFKLKNDEDAEKLKCRGTKENKNPCAFEKSDFKFECDQEEDGTVKKENCYLKKNNNAYGEIKKYIPEIDLTPHADFEEWFCPSFDDCSPDNDLGCYDEEKTAKNLKKFYGYEANSNELMTYCSARLSTLARACEKDLQDFAGKLNNLQKMRSDFIAKFKVQKGLEMLAEGGLNSPTKGHWEHIKNKAFMTINNNDCPDKEDKVKEAAWNAVKKWLKDKEDEIKKSSKTPDDYYDKQAWEAWEGNVNDIKTILITKGDEGTIDKFVEETGSKVYDENDKPLNHAGKDKYKDQYHKLMKILYNSRNLNRYLDNRVMELKMETTMGRTSKLHISDHLRVSSSSEEAKLSVFKDDGEKYINIIDKVIRLAVQILGTLAVLILIISGVMMVFSQGDENRLSNAKSIFGSVLIGLIIGFLSYTIVRFVIDTILT